MPALDAVRYLRVDRLPNGDDLRLAIGRGGVRLDGVEGPPDVERVGARLAVVEAEAGLLNGTLRVLPVIDGALGALSLPLFRPNPRLAAIACHPERIAARLGCEADAPAIVQARALTVLAAAACGVPAVLVASAPDEAAEREGFAALLLDDGR